jgi:hypothetical protein
MGTGAQSFYSTPGFELFRRGLNTQTIKKFRGINAFKSLATVTPEEAIDCLNVMIPGWGGLSKFRLPQAISAALVPNPGSGPVQFVDFQQGTGTRQVVAAFPDNSLWYFTWNAAGTALGPGTLIERGATDAPPWSMVEANNILFMANGQRMMKWTGTAFQAWGIAAPVSSPTLAAVALPAGTPLVGIQGTPSLNLISATVTAASGFTAAVGANVTIAGTVNYNGTYAVLSIRPTLGNNITLNLSKVAPSGVLENAGTINGYNPSTAVTGWAWSYAYKNSVTGHLGNISPVTPNVTPTGNNGTQLTAAAPTDPQVDTIVWFRTLDGGGDNFREVEINLATGALNLPNMGVQVASAQVGGVGQFIVLNDYNTVDSALDTATQGPLLNNPPPVGKYLAVGQSRVFIGNLVGGTNFIAYSGYEQILLGRPEESFPPNNRLNLQVGADSVNGVGVLSAGIVGYGATHKIYILRGNVEDITLNAPVQFSAFLQELPWDTGAISNQAIQPTPFGLIFWATDRTVQLFNPGNAITGVTASLRDISAPVYPFLRRATAGAEKTASSAYFNWLERDWYGLTFPIDGSVTNNFTIFWSLNLEGNELDVFPCSIGMDSMATLTTSKLQRIFAIASGGLIYNLPVSQDTKNGVGVLNVIPSTAGNLSAYWDGGYFGNENPVRSKMFKRGLIVADQGGFQVVKAMVDNRTKSLQTPKLIGPDQVGGDGQFSIGQRASRCSITVIFPNQDVSCNVQELTVGSIATSDRM